MLEIFQEFKIKKRVKICNQTSLPSGRSKNYDFRGGDSLHNELIAPLECQKMLSLS